MPMMLDMPTVTSRILNGLGEFMATKALDFTALARAAAIDPAAADDPEGFVSFAAVLDLFEAAAAAARDDAFGLHFAEFCPTCPIGLFHYVAQNAPTLREALKVRARFAKLVVSAYEPRFEEQDGIATYAWRCDGSYGPRQQFDDYIVMLLVERVRIMLLEPAWLPVEVDFEHAPPGSRQEFTRALGSHVQFNAVTTRVIFDAASLARQLPAADSLLFRELQRIAGQVDAAPLVSASVGARVRQYLVTSHAYDRITEADVARELGMSRRSMQRALAEDGTTFTAVVDNTRQHAARQLLLDTDRSLTEIAFMLGFSELSAFSRAARNWFSEPASAFRRRARKADATSSQR
jgi:AraC-like DNA-binding protein